MRKTLLLLILLSVFSVNSQNTNLLLNGGFESTTSNFPDDWATESGIVSINTTTVDEGLNSVNLIPVGSGSMLPTSTITQTFQLTDTEEHTFTFRYFLPGSLTTNPVDMLSYEFQNLQTNNAFFFTQGTIVNASNFVYDSWTTVTYTVRVLAFRNGATSADIKFTLRANACIGGGSIFFDDLFLDSNQNTLSLQEINGNTDVISYVNNKIIHLDNRVNSSMLYALDGKKVLENSTISNHQIDANTLDKGIYIMVLTLDDKKQLTKKILLN